MGSDADPPTRERMLAHEEKAEAAYAAMYDAPSRDRKDLKDDALFHLARAIELAEALDLPDDASRLKARAENIMAVWASQFRGTFR